jgi:hypothetical protein
MNLIYIAAGIALVATNIGWMTERNAHTKTKATHAEYIATAERNAREAESRNRATEQELRNAQEKHATEAAAIRNVAERHRANAAVARKRLQDATADATERARAQCADTGTAELRAPAGDPIGMLGRVLGEVDDFAGKVAAHADESRTAGLACQREYNTVRQAVNAVQ